MNCYIKKAITRLFTCNSNTFGIINIYDSECGEVNTVSEDSGAIRSSQCETLAVAGSTEPLYLNEKSIDKDW
ncbi:hypothetical protein ACH3XW_21080 [Acanthocheilonema viteae]